MIRFAVLLCLLIALFVLPVNHAYSAAYDLSVTISGDGGSVNSVPSGAISCTSPPRSGICSSTLPAGTSLQLVATPGAGSFFAGWSGSCSDCFGTTCPLILDAPKDCGVIYSSLPPVMIKGTPAVYSSVLQDAFNTSPVGATIQTRSISFYENLIVSRAVPIILSGGFDATFSDQPGYSILNGKMVIRNGTVVANKVIVSGTDHSPVVTSVEKKLTLDLDPQPTEVMDLGTFTVSASSGTAITFAPSAENLCDDVLYDRRVNNFNFDGLYRARVGSTDYFFRSGWQTCTDTSTLLLNVRWANGIVAPPGTYRFTVVSRDRVQNGTRTFTMIGDSISWWMEGEAFRVLLAQRLPGYRFTGSRTDIYGFGHEGEGGNGTPQVLARVADIVTSDTYWLLIGTNDSGTVPTLTNIQAIVSGLRTKNPAATIYVCTLLPRGDDKDIRNKTVSAQIREWVGSGAAPYLRLIDYDAALRGNPDWLGMLPDNLHPNASGYNLLADITAASL